MSRRQIKIITKQVLEDKTNIAYFMKFSPEINKSIDNRLGLCYNMSVKEGGSYDYLYFYDK